MERHGQCRLLMKSRRDSMLKIKGEKKKNRTRKLGSKELRWVRSLSNQKREGDVYGSESRHIGPIRNWNPSLQMGLKLGKAPPIPSLGHLLEQSQKAETELAMFRAGIAVWGDIVAPGTGKKIAREDRGYSSSWPSPINCSVYEASAAQDQMMEVLVQKSISEL